MASAEAVAAKVTVPDPQTEGSAISLITVQCRVIAVCKTLHPRIYNGNII
jgi:hypothetical protein